MITERVYLTRDNTIDVGFVLNKIAQEANVPTRIDLILQPDDGSPNLTFNTVADPTVFDVTQTDYVRNTLVSILILALGQESIVAGKYTAFVISTDPANLNGVTWPSFPVEVISL